MNASSRAARSGEVVRAPAPAAGQHSRVFLFLFLCACAKPNAGGASAERASAFRAPGAAARTGGSTAGSPCPSGPLVSREDARTLVAARFEETFLGLKVRNPIDGSLVPVGEISATELEITSETCESMTLLHDPLAGIRARATLDRVSRLVQFDRVELAVE